MAKCTACGQEMRATVSCTMTAVLLSGGSYPRIRYRTRAAVERCGDCGTPRGGLHHPGCDMETCPRCRGQLISCGC